MEPSPAVRSRLPNRHDSDEETILIVGASTRSAAHSACRAGFKPCCIDLYCDVDLSAVAHVEPVAAYPEGIIEAAAGLPEGPWMYTGALENHPQVVAALSVDRRLWGNGLEAIQAARNPWQVAEALRRQALPFLEVHGSDPITGAGGNESVPKANGAWMLKPVRSSAGRGIVCWEPVAERHSTLREPHYFQQFSAGLPISALYLGFPERTCLIGVTRQLIGLQAATAAPNVWCGNMAPWPLAHETINLLQEIGDTISRSCRLRGLFGCDFLLEGTVPRLTEINPRYTGSVELLEHLLLVPLLDWHRRACQGDRDATETEIRNLLAAAAERTVVAPGTAGRFVGKTILYARTDITATDLTRFARLPPSFDLPSIADIPHPNERFRAGQPVCTLFASGPTWEVCLQKLERRAVTCRIADAAAYL